MESEQEDSIKEKFFQCPICVTTPLSQVFQCENGHMLCDKCIVKVGPTCPQCRVPFGRKKIRVLAVEAMLDQVTLPCSSATYGCTVTGKRQTVKAHNQLCGFRAVNVCPNLGFPDCKVEVRSGVALMKHLKETHDNEDLLIFLEEETVKHEQFITLFSKPWKNTSEMRHVKTEFSGEIKNFLVVVKSDVIRGYLNCAVVYLGDEPVPKPEDYMATIELLMVQGTREKKGWMVTRAPVATWTGPPLHFKAAEDEKMIPYFSTPIKYLESRARHDKKGIDDDFRVRVKLAKAKSPAKQWRGDGDPIDPNCDSNSGFSDSDESESEVSSVDSSRCSTKRPRLQ